ncbi:transcriptional regulator [Cypionkella aquatica]|uniref:Transcriptional regulator n=1 Tax=Cypionkella aquatica TaxID=1756042 RepID=A0AA37X1Y9_9RHOB|nr:LacI family DNA-binding transcriptional regulator [Cypionkella aquatica]GLS88157.1 transcriptional regulator [Cypionkella aquatica]
MRPTTKDLAIAAGVSLATVDRVLNDRTGVRKDTVDRVNQAIEKLGFIRNMVAANLARGRDYRFLFLLPRGGDQFLAEVMARINEANLAFAAEMMRAEVRHIHDSDPHQIANLLGGLDPETVDGVAIMAPEFPQVRDAMARLAERGIATVSFISGQVSSASDDFVGIDNRAAGATAGRLMGRFAPRQPGKILVIAETMHARDSLERRLGFDEVIHADYPHLTVLPSLETYGDAERSARIIRASFASHSGIVGVYVPGSEARVPLEIVTGLATGATIIAHERTPFTEAALQAGAIDALITQDPGHLVRSAMRILRARCDRREILASQEKIRIEIFIRENL